MSSETTARGPWTGSSAVDGIAIGHAVVWASDPAPRPVVGTVAQEHTRTARAIARATAGVEELVRLLPRPEAELFEPEIAILGELGPALLARVDAGARPEDAVNEVTSGPATDLVTDARARLLDGLAYDHRSVEALLEGRDGERVLVTETLTPSVVASLPVRVVGIVAASAHADLDAGLASHAVILARARDIPLAFLPPDHVLKIGVDETVVLDTTASPARVWASPDDAVVTAAHARRDAWARARAEEEEKVTEPLAHLGVEVHVNIGSLHEHVPAAAEGIGLLRTELVFSSHAIAPSEAEQFGALRAIASRVGKAPVVARLFDAGSDKPLAWLCPPAAATARGIALLVMHPAVLDAQLRALVRAAEHANIRVLLPVVNCEDEVVHIRARTGGRLPIGAMVETPGAVECSDRLAARSDFLCIGTNDLLATVTGQPRVDATLSIDRRVLAMIARVVEAGHAHGRKVSVCGEMAGDPHTARILVGLGVDILSVAPRRFARVKLSLREVSIDDCREVAREASK